MNDKIRGWMVLTVLLAAIFAIGLAHADVAINWTNFPDGNFRQYLFDSGFDADGDGIFSDEELNQVKDMDCSACAIGNLAGIQYFTALTKLNCAQNGLTSLDVSKNTALTELYCFSNQLGNLDVSRNTALTVLDCGENQLTSLDVSRNTGLTKLACEINRLTSLDVSRNTALIELGCGDNQLTSLDVSKNTALTGLYCASNQLIRMDVSRNTALTSLGCAVNQLKNLDVSNNAALTSLGCSGNKLTSLDVSKNVALTSLQCHHNSIDQLDVSRCNKLIYLLKNCKRYDGSTYWGYANKTDGFYFDKTTLVIAGAIIIKPAEPYTYTDGTGTYIIDKGQAAFSRPVKSTAAMSIPDTIRVYGEKIKVTAIANKAFVNNKELTSVKIGKNVRKIGKNAFQGCVKLKTVKGGAGVTDILDSAFSGCKALKTFPVMNKLKNIGASAFLNCRKIAKFTLGATVKAIGKNAFKGCAALKTITVKTAKLTEKTVKAGAFKGIHAKAVFKCPKKQKAAYVKLFQKAGAPKTCVFK